MMNPVQEQQERMTVVRSRIHPESKIPDLEREQELVIMGRRGEPVTAVRVVQLLALAAPLDDTERGGKVMPPFFVRFYSFGTLLIGSLRFGIRIGLW